MTVTGLESLIQDIKIDTLHPSKVETNNDLYTDGKTQATSNYLSSDSIYGSNISHFDAIDKLKPIRVSTF